MHYSEMVKKASKIMFEAHKDDLDKGGYPYVFHPFYVAVQLDKEEEVCAALLHDVIEDHGDKYDVDLLRKEGFTESVLTALKLLSHDPKVPYMEYVEKLGKNSIARHVKIEDLKHNLDSTRTNGVKPHKHDLYVKALEYLQELDK